MRIVKLSDLSEKERTNVLQQQEIRKKKREEQRENERQRVKELLNQQSNTVSITNDKPNTLQNFVNGTGKVVDNLWQGMKNGVMSLQQTVGRAANNTQAEFWDLNNQMYKEALEGRMKNNPEESERINNAINNPLISGDKIREESKEYYDKIQKKKDENVLKIQQNTESMNTGVGKYIAGEIAPGIGQMLPGMIGGPIGTTYFIGSASGNYYDDAKKRGMTENQATMYSGVMGIIEGSLEVIGAKLTTNVGKQLLKKNIKGALVNYGLDIGENFLEESIVEPISEIIATTTAGKDKADWSNIGQRMWENGVAGAITSAITGGISGAIGTIGNKKTNNEQKVYDNEVKERTDAKVREATIEKAYNEQIKAQENLGIKITEDLKAEIMQKVEKAYDNGTLKTTELSKKDIIKIQDEVETDMQEGNISLENIRNVLGENQNISKDNLLMKSMYENEQKYNSYKIEQTDNDKVNILMQSATDAGMNNTSKTRKKVELISKLVKDTDRQYKFVSPEQLKQMGYNENAKGLIKKSTGEILINTQTQSVFESIVGHETTHIFDGKNKDGQYSKEYQMLQDMAIEYAKTKGIYDSKIQEITNAYGDLLVNESQIKEELTADLVGDFLFNDEKFIENLAVKDRNVFQKIYDYIKHIYKLATAGTDEAKALENLKYQFDKVYKTVAEETNADTKYSIGGKEGIKNAIKKDTGYLKLERDYNRAQQMQKNGIDNETIRKSTGWFQDKNGDWKFEFSDKDMTIKNMNFKEGKIYKLDNILEHDTLFLLYPELKNYDIIFTEIDANGSFKKDDKLIKINKDKLKSKRLVEGTMIHEIQHAIQSIEGFEDGTSSKFKLAYYNNLGEIEATDTKNRFILEKQGKLNRNVVAPESSKSNPEHAKLKQYLNERNLLDKIKDSVYNYFKNKNNNGDESYDEDYKQNKRQFNKEVSQSILQNGGEIHSQTWNRRPDRTLGRRRDGLLDREDLNYEYIEENNSKNKKQNVGLVDGRKRGRYVNEESENNSGSFNLDKNIKSKLTNSTEITGRGIAVKDMLVQQRPTLENEVGNTIDKTNISSEREAESNTNKYNRYKKNILKARETEVNNLIKNKNETLKQIENKIVQKEQELNNKKDKNTKTANNLKMQIENLKQRKAKIENEYNSRIDRKNDKVTKDKIDLETKKQLSLTRKEVKEQLLQKMNITEADISVGQDISAPNFQITDPVRVNEKVFGKEIGTKINEATINKTKHNTAEKIRWQNSERKEIADLNIKARSKESAAVQKYGEKQYIDEYGKIHDYGDAQLANDFKDVKTQEKIKNAAKVIRNKYDNFIDLANNVLTGLGYNPIPKRKDYMRHFQELSDKFSQTGIPLNLNDLKAEDLPTDINGLTEFNKPGKNWFASAMTRTGEKTTYDAITGIDGYIEGIGNLIFHTEDIQNYRALSSLIRDTYGQQHGLDNADNMTEDEVSKRIKDIQDNKLSKYVAWLDEQANSLAGKKGAIDRGFERALGRRMYTVLNTAKKQVGSNMTGFNVRSSLTNLVSSVMAASKTNKVAFAKGTVSTINNMFKQDDFVNKSDFLTSRFGSDMLSQKFWQKASNMGQIFMSGTDWFTSNQIVRSKYYEGLSKNMTESEAIKYADDFASRVMGDRSQGATAELFNSKTLGLFTQFQLEVNNYWQFMIHDTKIDYQQNKEENSGLKAGATAIFQMGQLAAYSYLFNDLFEKLTGSRATFDPIEIIKTLFGIDEEDDKKTFDERLSESGKLLIDNIPFANLFTDGGRIPVSEAFTGASTLLKKVTGETDKYGNVLTWEDVGKEFGKSLPYWVMPTGYSQAKKTIKGLSLYAEDVPGSYTDNGDLRYTVDDDVGSKVQSAIFGAYANPYAQNYIDSGFKTISKDNIDEMVGLDMNSSEYRQFKSNLSKVSNTSDKNGYKQYVDDDNNVYWYDSDTETMYDSEYKKITLTEDDLTKVSKTEEALNHINSLDLTDSQKTLVANNINKNSKKTIDMSEYGNYSSYDEYKYARDNPEKYSVVTQITDYDSYVKYKDDIADIKKKYSAEAGYESNERKAAVQSYINSLELNQYQKMMLEKMTGGYSIKNYQNYIYEYLETTNLSKSEKYAIWEELFN